MPLAAPPSPLDQTALLRELDPWCKGPGAAAYPRLATAVRALTCVSVFLSLLAAPLPCTPGQPTRLTRAVRDAVTGPSPIFGRARRKGMKCFAHAFAVMKSNRKEARLVCDPQVNKAMQNPDPCWMPHLHAITVECGNWQYGATLDMVGWFYQFTLSLAVGAFFCIRIPGTPGESLTGCYACLRMVMGWTWAVMVAQGVLIFCLHRAGIRCPAVPWSTQRVPGTGAGFVWVDNILLLGSSPQMVQAMVDRLTDVFDEFSCPISSSL